MLQDRLGSEYVRLCYYVFPVAGNSSWKSTHLRMVFFPAIIRTDTVHFSVINTFHQKISMLINNTFVFSYNLSIPSEKPVHMMLIMYANRRACVAH